MSISHDDVVKYRVTESFEFFIKYFFKHSNGRKFVLNDHHKQMIEAINDVLQGKTKRLIVNIAPRYSKTEIVVKMLIAYCLAMNAASKFIHLSYSDTLALDNSEDIRDLIQSEAYQELFNVQIKKDSKAKKKWYTTAGGGVYASAAGGQVTGFGAGSVDEEDEDADPYENATFEEETPEELLDTDEFLTHIENAKEFGGAIIIDDPIKPDDADSETLRDKINNRFDSTIRSRVNSRNTPIIVVMQRLHPEDLCGYLLDIEPDEWTVLSMPAINEDGSALWPFKHTIEELYKLQKANESVFKRQYMQDPEPSEGLMFAKDQLNYFEEDQVKLDDAEAGLSFVDIADKGEDNHSVPFGKMIQDKVFIHDVYWTKDGTDVNVPMTVTRANLHRPEYMQIESNFGGGMYIQLMQVTQEPSINGVTALIPMTAKANKHVRIQTLAGFIKEHFYFKKDFDKTSEYGQFMINLVGYTKTGKGVKHDDAPDSIAGLARMILNYFPDSFDKVYGDN